MSEFVHFCDERLWRDSAFGRRSEDLSPLFVDRYRGPRDSTALGAHEYWELTTVLGGEGVLLSKNEIPLRPYTICLIPPGVAHDERGAAELDTLWIGLRGNRMKRGMPFDDRPEVVSSRELAEFIERIWILSRQGGGAIGPELDGLAAAAVAWFLRIFKEGAPAGGEDLMGRVLRYLNLHMGESVFVEDIARRFGCSVGHFHRLFKRHTGCAPMVYLTHARIQHAAQLLQLTRLPVAEIGRRVGFDDPFYFSRVFRRQMGMAPSECRDRQRAAGSPG